MTKKIAISQSNYIPWKGYFDIINSVDEFVLYDDMQYTKRDWRNRNKIKTPNGTQWLTIPVEVKGKYYQKINETLISDPTWAKDHWNSILHNYAQAPYFKDYKALLEQLYFKATQFQYLSEINRFFLESLCNILGIKTKFYSSSEFTLEEEKTARLVSICRQLGATHYYTGPAAKAYMEETQFESVGIQIIYYDYSNYPVYNQLFPPFDHAVSIIDTIMNEGHNTNK
ncbi:MAG TPA: WbqC family protein, partial [bacterium]|nr:WbqC family protein [bacterium]